MWKHKNFINLQLCAPASAWLLKINFDTNITKIETTDSDGRACVWTVSGQTTTVQAKVGNNYTFTCTLTNGYVLDTTSAGNIVNDNQFVITFDGNTAEVTITTRSATPTLTFKHFFEAGTIGSGTVKFRHYSQQEPSSGGTVEMPNISNWTATKVSGDFAGTLTLYTTNNDGNKIQCGPKGYEWITKINAGDIEIPFSDVASVFGITQDSDGNNITSSEWDIASAFDNRVTNDGLDGGSCIMQIDTNGHFSSLTSTDVRVLVYDANTDTMRVDTCEIDETWGYLTTKYAYGFNQIFCTIIYTYEG